MQSNYKARKKQEDYDALRRAYECLMLLRLYNTIAKHVKTEKTQKAVAHDMFTEFQRLNELFKMDEQLIELAVSKFNTVLRWADVDDKLEVGKW